MDAATILILGAVLLGFGAAGLFLARESNRNLKGLGWMGAAFASGSVAASLLLTPSLPGPLSAALPDVLTLLPFVLFQMAVCELLNKPLLPRFGNALLAALTVADVVYKEQHLPGAFRITSISLLVVLQCCQTALLLWRYRNQRRPALFCSLLLFLFCGFNVLRAVLVDTGLARRWHMGNLLLSLSLLLYIAVGLGLAFGLFWLSSVSFLHHLEEMAGTDPLTRVSNRRTFLRACEKELRASARKARPLSVLMADLDHFKRINDHFGHEAGDRTLVTVVERMQDSIRGIDVLGRWGGEEFVVLLPNANEEAALIVAERMRRNVERTALPVGPDGAERDVVRITISIGAATFQPHDDVYALLRRADQCLYLAKDAGRNRVLQAA